jgi:hypothetical protein
MPDDINLPTWFKLHDFSVTATDLPLGTIVENWRDPSTAIFVPGDTEEPAIKWPAEHPIVTEQQHSWHDSSNRSSAVNILLTFFKAASANTDVQSERHRKLRLGKVDLKIKKFVGVRPFSDDALKTIVSQKKVNNYINSGPFAKKDIYIITALRLADTSFEVGMESGSTNHTNVSGSVEAPKAPVKTEVSHNSNTSKSADHSYKTAKGEGVGDGVVFAYQMHVIREKRGAPAAQLFANKKGFMTSGGILKVPECVAVTKDMDGLDTSLVEDVGDGEYLYLGSLT